jgi:hypothetical protein
MALPKIYHDVEVESYLPARTSGLHGKVHVRPLPGQGYADDMHVECSRSVTRNYPVGTKFRLRCTLTDRLGGGQYLYSSWQWKFEVLETPKAM